MGNFSETLLALRKKSKQSQRTVSDKLGISQALLSHYEHGIREPRIGFISTLARYYGVSCDYLLGADNELPPETQKCTNTVVSVLSEVNTRFGQTALNSACDLIEATSMRVESVLENPQKPYDPSLAVAVATAGAGFISAIREAQTQDPPESSPK